MPARADALTEALGDGAHRFDGRDDRVSAPIGAIGRPGSLTVELWLRRASSSGRRAGVLVTDARTPLADGFTLFLDARHRPVFALGGKRGRHGAVTGPVLAAGRVYHLAAASHVGEAT